MKLTEAKLKQLILEQLGSFELGNLIAYLEELQAALSSVQNVYGDLGVTNAGGYATSLPRLQSYYFSSLSDWFQLAIDSVAKEIEEGRHSKSWDNLTLTRLYETKNLGHHGNVLITMILQKDKNIIFYFDQLDENGDTDFSYFEGNSISTKALVDFFSASDEDILEFVKEQFRMHGKKTMDSAEL